MAATPFDAILEKSRDLIEERVTQAVSAMLERAEATLNDLIDKTEDSDSRSALSAGRDAAQRQREAIEREFGERFSKGFRKRVRKVKRGLNRQVAGDQTGAFEIELELLDDQDLEETLRYNRLAARIRRHCDEGLGALDQRAAVMLGDGNLQSEDNPFGPQVFCDAFKNACREAEADTKARAAFMHLFDGQMLDDLRSGYDDVNELLVENSILPKIRYTVVKKDRGTSKRGAEEGDDAVEERAPAPQALPGDVFGALQKLLGGGAMPAQGGAGDGMGVGGVPMAQGAELLSSLTRIQVGNLEGVTGVDLASAASGLTNVLAQLKQSSVGRSMGQVDAMTLDIVSMLFDQLFDDAKVPAGVKALAGRLQIPMLKIALADKTLFSRKDHPGRVLLDVLGEFAARLPADFDEKHALHAKLEPILREVVEKFEDKVDVFVAANEKLGALVAEEDARAAETSKVEATRLEQLENLSVGRGAAQQEIRARLVERHPPHAVRRFLVHQWVKVLLVSHAQGSTDGAAWKDALETMDKLITSVEPKPTLAERRALATQVPGLLRSLTTGLNAVGVEDGVRTAFYADLMKLHTSTMTLEAKGRPGDGTATTATRDATPSAPRDGATTTATRAPADGAASPATTATRSPGAAKPGTPAKAAPQADESLDFTAEITVTNPFGGGQVNVDELDFTDATPALAQAAPAASAAADAKAVPPRKAAKEHALPSKLKEGVWVGIRAESPEEPRQPAKLLYMSPLKSRFLFCDRAGKTVLECNRADLAKRFRARDLVILSEAPDTSLFERIIRGVMGKLGAA